MAANSITVFDLVQQLSPKDKQKLLNALRKDIPTPCETKGHSYKNIRIGGGLFMAPQVSVVCTKCGDTLKV